MNWTDEEIDELFGDAANKQVFEYKSEYWKDIEKQLPVNKQGDRFYWWWTSCLFFLVFIGLIGMEVVEDKSAATVNNASLSLQSTNSFTIQNVSKVSYKRTNQVSNNTVNNQLKLSENSKNQKLTAASNLNINSITNINEGLIASNKIHDLIQNQSSELTVVSNLLDNEVKSNSTLQSQESYELNNLANTNHDNITNKEGLKLITKELSFTQIETQLEIVSFNHEKQKLRQLYLELYGGLGQSYINDETNANTVNASVGGIVGITFPVNKFNMSVGLGLQATKFDQLNILDRTKVYGFGSEILENSYEFSSIYAITLPVSIGYSFGRHSVNIGLRTNFNLMTQLKHRQTLDGEMESYSSGYSDVSFFNKIGFLPSLGYSFSLNENTHIGVRLNVQLLQQLKSDRFIGSPLNNPIDGQIFLKRNLNF